MPHFRLFDRDDDRQRDRQRLTPSIPQESEAVQPSPAVPESIDMPQAGLPSAPVLELESPKAWMPRPDRRTTGEKIQAGLAGLKLAIRGDSSFFAHAYRGVLIIITAAILGLSPIGWCFLVVSAALVLIAELAHSAVDTLARALGDPEAPGLKAAREIATGGVLVAAVTSGAITLTVLVLRLGVQLGWWD